VITPGTVTDTNVLTAGENNFLLAISDQDGQLGCAFLDISTGELRVSQFGGDERWNHLLWMWNTSRRGKSYFPKEQKKKWHVSIVELRRLRWTIGSSMRDYAARILHEQFGIATLDGFGLAGKSAAIAASGAMIHYVRQTQKTTLDHITGLTYSESADYLVLDRATIRNLELFEPSNPTTDNTKDRCSALFNKTRTGMGAPLVAQLVGPAVNCSCRNLIAFGSRR